jgi:hypothetical protein
LKNGWYVPIDEENLQPFLLAMFNVDTKAYLKHILPLLLVKELVHTTPETVEKNLVFDIQLAHKRGKDPNAEYLERPITFNPKKCTDLPLWTKPDNEDWKEDFDPTAPVETEFLEYVLVGALGETEMQRLKQFASQRKPRKRKTTDAATEETSSQIPAETVDVPAAKKQRKAPASQANVESSAITPKVANKSAAKPKAKPTKRHGKTVQPVEQPEPAESEASRPPVKKGFQLPRALVRNPSMLSQLASQSSQDVLSRCTSFESDDLAGEPSRRHSASMSALASQSFDNETQPVQKTGYMAVVPSRENQRRISPKRTHTRPSADLTAIPDVPPSSQLNPAAQLWSFSRLEDTTAHEDIPVAKVQSKSKPRARFVQQVRRPIFGEETPSPESMPASASLYVPPISTARPPPLLPSVPRRGCVVVDLESDDEDIPPAPVVSTPALPALPRSAPARPPAVSQVAVPPVRNIPTPSMPTPPAPQAPISPARDSREAIAAARLKHFEKKVHETIRLGAMVGDQAR